MVTTASDHNETPATSKPPVKHPSIDPPVHTQARQLHIIFTATAFNTEILSSERSIANTRSPPLPLITTTKKKASHKHLQIPPESINRLQTRAPPSEQHRHHKTKIRPKTELAGESGAEKASASRKQGRRRWSSRNLHLPKTNPNLNSLFPHTEPHTIASRSTTDDVVTLSEVSTTDEVRTRAPTKRKRKTALKRQGNSFSGSAKGSGDGTHAHALAVHRTLRLDLLSLSVLSLSFSLFARVPI
ncbi:hypothetical protein HID58_015781 [Brassica napus]|uniref:Uncharacterized protein n=1 Tax=Brassica napus TaxID=3708 RepID=A0ABQ8DL22_BRANA|nr:hypothetical protein HID58_015781 [Brassica napus]